MKAIFSVLLLGVTLISVSLVSMAQDSEEQDVVLVFGDSLSTGFGLDPDRAWFELVRKELEPRFSLINASDNGRHLRGAHTNFALVLNQHQPDIVLIALGINDMASEAKANELQQALVRLIFLAKEQGIKVGVLGVYPYVSDDSRYQMRIDDAYLATALELSVAYLPWIDSRLIETVSAIQDDGLHLSENIQPILAARAVNFIEALSVNKP